jgi:type I restriction enzyme S subunit
MTPQELKNSILQLAIQGKLVPQRAEEGNAEDLYKQIQAEKQKLIKEGKIKKEKPLPPINDDEKPFEIPGNWKWVRLGEIGSWASGATPSRSNPDYYNGTIPWLKTGDLNDSYITDTSECITELALFKTSVRLNPIGSVLIAMYGATIGKIGILKIDATTNQACCACIPLDGILNKYIFYFLLCYRQNFIKMGAGGAQPNISKEKIINTSFPLPPLAEQKRIVAKIEELLPYVERYETAYNKLQQLNKRFPVDLQKSVLQLAIQGRLVPQRPEEGNAEGLYQQIQAEKQKLIKEGKIKKEKPLPPITDDEKPFEIPASWKWVRLGEIGSWASGATPSRSNPDYYNGTIPWLKTGDLNDSYITDTSEYITELALSKTSVRLNPIGSVLIAMYGATIGKIAILKTAATTNQACCACIAYNGIYNKYLFYFLLAYRKNFIKMGAGGAQPNISKEKIVNTIFPFPPLPEQKRIVAKIEEIIPLCNKLK